MAAPAVADAFSVHYDLFGDKSVGRQLAGISRNAFRLKAGSFDEAK